MQVYENQIFTVKCEVPETNPVSNVNAYIDNKELKLTRLEKRTVDNRMTINTYSFDINATRNMNGKKVKCEARMKDLPTELANSIDLRSHISKDYTLSVYYLPQCVHSERIYRTGINRSIIIECPINGSNPDVSNYKIIAPSTKTKVEMIESDLETLRKMGRFRINPVSRADFGLYECIPRSLAGTAKCDINVELGSTPNPPEQCNVQFAVVNNKTYAQFSCKPGFNQGGLTSFLTIYEINPMDKELKLSGRVNIDESKTDKEVPYITPADQDKYYEFLIMQENNYGNSTSIVLTLGVSEETKEVEFWSSKNMLMIGTGSAILIFIFLVCACCCFSDSFSSTKSDNPCCKCCSDSEQQDGDMSTYKKAPLDSDIAGSVMINQPFQGFNQEINSKNFGVIGSTYEYYDNASAGLLAENNYTRYQQKNVYNQQFEEEEEIEEEEEDDHYMNNDIKQRQPNHYNQNNYDDDSSEASSGRKSSQDDQQVFITDKGNTKKSVYEDTRTKLASKVGSAAYNLNTNNNYSTIDSKNLKLIKTENGLVYTPLHANNTLKKNRSTDALETKEDAFNELDETQRKPIIASTYSNVKKITNNTPINSSFQNELSMRLKSINKEPEQSLKVNNNPINSNKIIYQSEPMSNSTATTSLSSASSCTSNSDLTIKKDFNKRLAPLANNDTNDDNNPSYSLLKTTLNINGTDSTLSKSTTRVNGATKLNTDYNSYKPPILKPKPRANNIYGPTKKHLNATFESIHNQSGDPLLNQTSPCTSVTDVSSTNCTPQHYNSNIVDDITSNQLNNLVKNNYKTATIQRNASSSTPKATTTFTTNPIGDGSQLIYSTTKINGNVNDLVTTSYVNGSGNSLMRTFGNNSYETTTLNRKNTNKKDETNKFPDVNNATRTLERRHVKNSEC